MHFGTEGLVNSDSCLQNLHRRKGGGEEDEELSLPARMAAAVRAPAYGRRWSDEGIGITSKQGNRALLVIPIPSSLTRATRGASSPSAV